MKGITQGIFLVAITTNVACASLSGSSKVTQSSEDPGSECEAREKGIVAIIKNKSIDGCLERHDVRTCLEKQKSLYGEVAAVRSKPCDERLSGLTSILKRIMSEEASRPRKPWRD